MDANKRQVGGDHYKSAVQHWDLAAIYGWDYFTARAIAYLMRWPKKNGIQDLEKAVHFIQKKIEVEKAEAAGTLERDILMVALRTLGDQELRAKAEFHTAQDMMSALAKKEKQEMDGPNYPTYDPDEMYMGHHVACAYLHTLNGDGERHACDCGHWPQPGGTAA